MRKINLGKIVPKKGVDYFDGKNGSSDTPNQILDKISGLLKINDIEGLSEELKKIKEIKQRNVLFGGGGFNYGNLNIHILDPYTPTGTINGINKDFTLSHAPSPATSLKVYRGGQKQQLTTDYTLSGMTISFLVAPVVGEILEVEHRI